MAQGGVLDATNMSDSPMNASATGSDTGGIPGLKTVTFAYDNSALSASAKQLLSDNAAWMNANPNVNVQIEGHCDERGSVEYNLALGERRAKAVKDYLQSIGVNPSQMLTISYGEEKLLSYGDSESDHSKNRRANFLPLQ
jgi:peptidoglycan-associated lipoprotein